MEEDRRGAATPMRLDDLLATLAPPWYRRESRAKGACEILRRRDSFVRKALWNFHINSSDRGT